MFPALIKESLMNRYLVALALFAAMVGSDILAASPTLSRSVSEGERFKNPGIRSYLERAPSLTLRLSVGLLAWLPREYQPEDQ